MVVGSRAEFVARFATAWRGMGFTGPVLVPQECAGLPSIIRRSRPAGSPICCAAPTCSCSSSASPRSADDEPVRTGREARRPTTSSLKIVERLFRQAASTEAETRPKGRRTPRRFIGVNVIYNKYWRMFTDYVGANINPFCSQVLAGNPRAGQYR